MLRWSKELRAWLSKGVINDDIENFEKQTHLFRDLRLRDLNASYIDIIRFNQDNDNEFSLIVNLSGIRCGGRLSCDIELDISYALTRREYCDHSVMIKIPKLDQALGDKMEQFIDILCQDVDKARQFCESVSVDCAYYFAFYETAIELLTRNLRNHSFNCIF